MLMYSQTFQHYSLVLFCTCKLYNRNSSNHEHKNSFSSTNHKNMVICNILFQRKMLKDKKRKNGTKTIHQKVTGSYLSLSNTRQSQNNNIGSCGQWNISDITRYINKEKNHNQPNINVNHNAIR